MHYALRERSRVRCPPSFMGGCEEEDAIRGKVDGTQMIYITTSPASRVNESLTLVN
jgi:hypothetical protein